MRGRARPWVAAILAIALAAFAVLALGEHGAGEHPGHAVECGLCLFAQATPSLSQPTLEGTPQLAEDVSLAEILRPIEAAAPRTRARDPPDLIG